MILAGFIAGVMVGILLIAFIDAGKAGEADENLRGTNSRLMLERDNLARKLEQIRALLEGP